MSHPPASPTEPQNLTEACDALARSRSFRSPDAADVAQEACIRALEVREPAFIRDPVRYLMRIGRNLLVDRSRKRTREAAVLDSLSVVSLESGAAADPERILAGKQELRRVLETIGKLPPRCREAFLLHRFDGLSYAAIARRMGVSTSMVEKHIAEAMLRIHRAMHPADESAL